MKHFKYCGFYEHRQKTIVRNYGGWVVVDGYDWNVYKTLQDVRNAIDKKHDGSHKGEPRVIRQMTKDEFIHAFP